jgi:subtilisin family serine protease
MRRNRRLFVVPLVVLTLVVGLATPASSQSSRPSRSAGIDGAERRSLARAQAKVSSQLARQSGPVAVFIELTNKAAADAFDENLASGTARARQGAREAKASADRTSEALVAAVRANGGGARELFRTHNAVAGLALVADESQLRTIATRPDVVSIKPLVVKTTDNAHAAQLTRVLNTWQDLGLLGDGVRVGIIDSGIDYTHSNFGGAGTPEAYESIDPTDASGVFPTAKVVGGRDFAGDAYNPRSNDPALSTPAPDDNPLDCDGHGSHVAGTAAGFGVNADGSTFAGDYAALTSDGLDQMRIGPGMAPHASLYALKVFGCPSNGTLLTPLALDWALDPNQDGDFSDHLDLVNGSLSSPYTTPDDPENTFVRRLANHGVLSVFSAGNEDDFYDISGAPGNTPEALSVASTRDRVDPLDVIEVTAPAESSGLKAGHNSFAFIYGTSDGVTAPVAKVTDPNNADG